MTVMLDKGLVSTRDQRGGHPAVASKQQVEDTTSGALGLHHQRWDLRLANHLRSSAAEQRAARASIRRASITSALASISGGGGQHGATPRWPRIRATAGRDFQASEWSKCSCCLLNQFEETARRHRRDSPFFRSPEVPEIVGDNVSELAATASSRMRSSSASGSAGRQRKKISCRWLAASRLSRKPSAWVEVRSRRFSGRRSTARYSTKTGTETARSESGHPAGGRAARATLRAGSARPPPTRWYQRPPSVRAPFHTLDFFRSQAACLPKPRRRQVERRHQLVDPPLQRARVRLGIALLRREEAGNQARRRGDSLWSAPTLWRLSGARWKSGRGLPQSKTLRAGQGVVSFRCAFHELDYHLVFTPQARAAHQPRNASNRH